MKRMISFACVLAVSATLAAQTHPMSFNDLAAIRRIGAPQLSPDGKWIAYQGTNVDLPGNMSRSAVYLLPATGGTSRQISDGASKDEGPAWSADGKKIAWVSNRDGGSSQIYVYDVTTGSTRKVSDLPGGGSSLKWLPDGSGFVAVSDVYPDCGVDPACAKNRADTAAAAPTKARVIDSLLYRHWNQWVEATRSHVVFVPMSGAARDLTPGKFDAPPFSVGGGDEFDVSPDSKELVYASKVDPHPEISTNGDLFIVAIGGGAAKQITTRTGDDTSPHYSPDGRWIAYRSQARPGYESDLWELWLYDRTTGQSSHVASSYPDWINSMTWARDSKSIFITGNEKSKEPIYEVSLPAGNVRKIYGEGSADGVQVSPDGKTLYFQRSTLTRPADIFSVPRKGAVATQLTHDNDALLASIAMGATSDIWYAGAEGTQVQALLVKPPAFDATKKYPALVLIHGGPQGAWNDGWSYRWNPQMFASAGYVVLMPNPRGSTGYGQKFVEDISGDWGGKVYTDIMNGVDQFAAMPFVDPSRMGAAGGSYGGYMIDWILGHTDRFKALATHDGVYDLTSMYGTTEELWFAEWEFHGNPWDSPELYQKWSPSQYVKNFKTPTLIIHSELDYRVPVSQGMELFTALQRKGIPSKFLYFPDEGHWVLKPQNSKLWYQTVTDWFNQWLK